MDNFSKFVTLGALPDRRSDTIAQWLHANVVCLYGRPLLIKSDGGSEFKGAFKELCEMLEIRHHTTLPYHPQSNGMAERFVRTTKTYLLRHLANHDTATWEETLPQIQFCINTTIATPHGYTPYQLQFGTNVSQALDPRF